MWILLLNDMRSSKIEMRREVARAETKQALVDFMARERVEPYRDGHWGKSFRQGGLLEWCNPPYDFELESHFFDADAYLNSLRAHMLCLPEVA